MAVHADTRWLVVFAAATIISWLHWHACEAVVQYVNEQLPAPQEAIASDSPEVRVMPRQLLSAVWLTSCSLIRNAFPLESMPCLNFPPGMARHLIGLPGPAHRLLLCSR